jgi:membrane protein DedA with SNARE-associated domain
MILANTGCLVLWVVVIFALSYSWFDQWFDQKMKEPLTTCCFLYIVLILLHAMFASNNKR